MIPTVHTKQEILYLISVGNSSAVYTKTMAKLPDAPNLPINAMAILKLEIYREKRMTTSISSEALLPFEALPTDRWTK